MKPLESIHQAVRGTDDGPGGEEELVPADAGVEDVCPSEIETVAELLEPFAEDKESVIPALQEIQEEYGYLPRFAMQLVAEHAGTSLAHVYGTASFYSQFYLEPRGEYTIKVCTGTACHVKGADEISAGFRDELDVDLEEVTDDGQFSISHVRCIGACSLAPAVMVGDQVHGNVTEEKITAIVDEYADGQREVGGQ